MKNKLWIATLIIGLIIGHLLTSTSVPEPTIVTETHTEYITDTLYVKSDIKPISETSIPDIIQTTSKGLIRSTKVFDTDIGKVTVSALAECKVQLFELKIEEFKPMRVVFDKPITTIETVKTVVIEPAWYKPNTVGIIVGVVSTVTLVWAAGQLK